jgi:hypothetical protein
MLSRKEHLTKEGLQQIVNLRASINNGLSDELKCFPGVKPVQRPLVTDQEIKNPYWISGFVCGCFFIDSYKSKTKVGFAVHLNFFYYSAFTRY